MFDYILNGTCAGGLLSNLDIAFGLSEHADKTGKYCDLEAIGPLLQNQFVSLQMSANISAQMLRALDSLVSLSAATGQYSAQVRGAYSIQRSVLHLFILTLPPGPLPLPVRFRCSSLNPYLESKGLKRLARFAESAIVRRLSRRTSRRSALSAEASMPTSRRRCAKLPPCGSTWTT